MPSDPKCFADNCKEKPVWWADTPLGYVYACERHREHLRWFRSQGWVNGEAHGHD